MQCRLYCTVLPVCCVPVLTNGAGVSRYSFAVGAVVRVGPGAHAVSPVRRVLDLLEEVRRPQDADALR